MWRRGPQGAAASVAGTLVFEHAVFRHEASDQRLVRYSPLSDEDTAAKLARLLAPPG